MTTTRTRILQELSAARDAAMGANSGTVERLRLEAAIREWREYVETRHRISEANGILEAAAVGKAV